MQSDKTMNKMFYLVIILQSLYGGKMEKNEAFPLFYYFAKLLQTQSIPTA